jgi:hypothetical protein
MAGLFPNNQTLSIFGKEVIWPGVDSAGKFTNGSFSDPEVLPSSIPAESMNLVLDNLGNLITALGLIPNNISPVQLRDAIVNAVAPRTIGELKLFSYEPSALELVRMRLLPLNGQIVDIPTYADLCALKYCGDSQNDTATFWYKCSDPAGQIRDIGGQYMRILDQQGVFVRPAGQNSVYTAADGTPYNGFSPDTFLGDAIRNITGQKTEGNAGGAQINSDSAGSLMQGAFKLGIAVPHGMGSAGRVAGGYALSFDASQAPNVTTSYENRGASNSYIALMTY